MTDQQIRLHFGELNADEMRLARAIVGWHEREKAKLRAAADVLAEALEDSMFYLPAVHLRKKRAALAAYQATKRP